MGHSFGGLVMRRYALMYPGGGGGHGAGGSDAVRGLAAAGSEKQSQLDLGRRLIRYAQPIAVCGLTRLAVTSLFRRSKNISGRPERRDGARAGGM